MEKDDLVTALGELEQAVTAASADQERALAGLEQALTRRVVALRSPDGRVVDVDRPLLPSPGEDRKAAGLQHELEVFLQQTQALRAQVQGAAASSAVAPLADGGTLRDQVRILVAAIRRMNTPRPS